MLSPTSLYVFTAGEPGGVRGPRKASSTEVDDSIYVSSQGTGLSGESEESGSLGHSDTKLLVDDSSGSCSASLLTGGNGWLPRPGNGTSWRGAG